MCMGLWVMRATWGNMQMGDMDKRGNMWGIDILGEGEHGWGIIDSMEMRICDYGILGGTRGRRGT